MTLAFCFPGQGSQAVGMGKALADEIAAAREVFARVDAALGEKLSALMWEGPEETLRQTENAQPALMAVSIAAVEILKQEFGVGMDRATYLAGHSLGEATALCAAGSLGGDGEGLSAGRGRDGGADRRRLRDRQSRLRRRRQYGRVRVRQ